MLINGVYVMRLVKVEELPTYIPPDHSKTFIKKVIEENVGAKNVEVMLGVAESGGRAEMHAHTCSEHIFYVIKGRLRVKNEKEEVEVKEGMALFIPPGEAHQPYNPGPDRTIYLIINSPPLQETKSWKR